MRVMYVAGNPQGARPLEVDREIADIQERLDRAASADPIEFRAYAVTAGSLGDTVRRTAPDVLHIAAHGHDDAVMLAEPDRPSILVDGSTLAKLLAGLPHPLRLIVINACSSSEMAASLARAGVADFVIGTDASVTNAGARSMAGALYLRLADGASIGDAFMVASAHLDMLDDGRAQVELHPAGSLEHARTVRLVDPLRILACFPLVDKWIDAGLAMPDKDFRPAQPNVLLGVAGAPAAARQTVLFTDDDAKARPPKAGLPVSPEESKCWIVDRRPDAGRIWMPDHHSYWGDMNWYAAVTTTDGRLVSAKTTTVAALRRYYFDERVRTPAPAIAELIERSMQNLVNRSRRGRSPLG